MKIFIDSADIEEIKQAFEWGVVDGVTTNPSLLKKAVDKRKAANSDLDLKSYITEILTIAKGTPVSLEVTELEPEKMVEQGKKLFALFNPVAGNVNIKIPINPSFAANATTHFDGIAAIKALRQENIPVNCTLIFTPEQAMLAAKAGANFISPFAGRIDDMLRKNLNMQFEKTDYYPAEGVMDNNEHHSDNGVISGIDLVEQCVEIIEKFGFDSEIIAASLRNTRQVRESALVGSHIATIPFGVIGDMLKHDKTFEGMDAFTKDIVQEYVDLTK